MDKKNQIEVIMALLERMSEKQKLEFYKALERELGLRFDLVKRSFDDIS